MQHSTASKWRHTTLGLPIVIVASILATGPLSNAFAADATALQNRTIGYALIGYQWSTYATPGAKECPEGVNDGPREHYAALFPEDGATRKLVDTELAREAHIWHPDTQLDPFKYKEPTSKIVSGLNLDGKVDANDFTSPDGEPGIDNQFYRVIGCIEDLRPGGYRYSRQYAYLRGHATARLLIELTDVDSLVNDDDVTVTTYRGVNPLLLDAAAESFLPYGTQRVDARWSKVYIHKSHGKIKDGVLETEPSDANIPLRGSQISRSHVLLRDARLKLALHPEKAKGLWAGYLDVKSYHYAINSASSTNTLTYGRQDMISIYHAMMRNADAYPDPETGKNTAISGALDAEFTRVFIEHPNQVVGSKDADVQAAAIPSNPEAKGPPP